MSIRPYRDINRRKTKVVNLGNIKVGGDNPISVQSMTNTLTTDIKATINQINEIQNEGADLVRVSCPDQSSTKALKEIIKNLSKQLEQLNVNSVLQDKTKNIINDQKIKDVKVRFQKVQDLPPKDLRKLVDIGKKVEEVLS